MEALQREQDAPEWPSDVHKSNREMNDLRIESIKEFLSFSDNRRLEMRLKHLPLLIKGPAGLFP